MSIRIRLVVMCLVVALLPSIPLSFLVHSLLEKSFNVGLSPDIEEALQSGLVISRERLEQIRTSFERKAESIQMELFGKAVDSSTAVGVLARHPDFSEEFDGIITGNSSQEIPEVVPTGDLPGGMSLFAAHPTFIKLTGRSDVVQRQTDTPKHGLSFYETTDHSTQFAVLKLKHGGAWKPLLLYSQIDPDFLEQADRLLTGRQIFAQLRLDRRLLSRSFFYPFIIIYSAILLLSLAFALLMAERLAAPIRRLAHGTKIVAGGDWSYRLKTRTGGEVGRLVEAFNAMVSRLAEQRKRLIDMEKMAAWREMARRLAHEIKNPILPIRLTMQELKDQYNGDDKRYGEFLADSARIVEDELKSLQRLVKEFSSFARMPEISPRRGSLESLTRDVAKFYPQISTKISAAPSLPYFPFDPDQLRRTLVNLFDNAITAFGESKNGEIQIALRREDEDAVLVFSDNGPGISPEHLPRIFDPYYTSRREGTGLGLSMVQNIVLLHGGSIDVQSKEGKGTTFTIKIPLERPDTGSIMKPGEDALPKENPK